MGPRRVALEPGARGWKRFVQSTLAVLHHELLLLANELKLLAGERGLDGVETKGDKLMLHRRGDFIQLGGKFPRLTKTEPLAVLKEIKRLLLSLRTEHGAYSEVFIHSPAGNGIGRLIVDPYSLLLFSSRAEDFNAINEKRAAGNGFRVGQPVFHTKFGEGTVTALEGEGADAVSVMLNPWM